MPPGPPSPLLLIKQIGPRAAQVHDLGTTIAILLEAGALEAVEGITDTLAAAHDALVLVVAEGALVADARQRRRPHVRVAHGTLAVAFVAQPPDVDPGQFAAHHQVWVVARHVMVRWFGGGWIKEFGFGRVVPSGFGALFMGSRGAFGVGVGVGVGVLEGDRVVRNI